MMMRTRDFANILSRILLDSFAYSRYVSADMFIIKRATGRLAH